jgi:hypothetical protein
LESYGVLLLVLPAFVVSWAEGMRSCEQVHGGGESSWGAGGGREVAPTAGETPDGGVRGGERGELQEPELA